MSGGNELFFGKVIFFNAKKGYGFISWSKSGIAQKDIFAHFSDISMEGYKSLLKDQNVQFELGLNNRGQVKAINIIVLKN